MILFKISEASRSLVDVIGQSEYYLRTNNILHNLCSGFACQKIIGGLLTKSCHRGVLVEPFQVDENIILLYDGHIYYTGPYHIGYMIQAI